jgi:DNA polymerase III subunit delta
MAKLHAIDYLAQPAKYPPKPVCIAYGSELFLRRQVLLGIRNAVLKGDEGDFSFTSFEGRTVEFRDVIAELTTLSMFGGPRLVVIENADEGPKSRASAADDSTGSEDEPAGDTRTKKPAAAGPVSSRGIGKGAKGKPADEASGFVARYRPQLEDYVAHPSRNGILVLDLKSCPSNTRLYKAVDAQGLIVDCGTPVGAKLTGWLNNWARQTHQIQLSANAVDMLLELVGPELGLLDQELAKLALAASGDKKITPEMVQKLAGGWHAKTTWEMLDLALEGKVADALRQIDLLIASNQVPIALLAQISATLRRMAAATRLILQSEAAGRRIGLAAALQQAGVQPFALHKTESQLKRLTRQRGGQLYRWLLQADLDLKGDSAIPPRLVLERLIVRLASPA